MSAQKDQSARASRDKARARLRNLTGVALVATTGATAGIAIVVAHEHPGKSAASTATTGQSTGGTTGTTGSSGNTGDTGSSTGNTGNSGASSFSPSTSSKTPSVTSGGSGR